MNTTSEGSMAVVLRHCRREDQGSNDASSADNENCDANFRKKMRLPKIGVDPPHVVSPASTGTGEIESHQEPSISPPRQWWFSRHSSAAPLQETSAAADASSSRTGNHSGMVLCEHLGRASDVVESLTHDVKNWSLTRLSPAAGSTTKPSLDNNKDCVGSSTHKSNVDRKKEKQKRCKEAQRQVRMARRQCLEAQKRLLLSSAHPAAMD